MSQHDLEIANQGFPATRADINNALQALGSLSSGATAPATTYANQLWYDTANNVIKIRNEDNDAWISLMTLDQAGDLVTRFDVDNIRLDGNTISSTDTNGNITLDPDGTGNLIVASGNVGIGTSSPATPLTVQSDANTLSLRLLGRSADDRSDLEFYENDGTTKIAAISTETDNIGIIASGASSTLSMAANTSRFRNTSGTELMRIDSSGNVGIGTGSPSFTSGNGLHLADNYFAGFGSGASGRPDFQIGTVGGSTLDFRCGTGSDTVDLSISTGGLFTGDFNDTSDERLKENIQNLATNQIDVVKQLRPVTFDWKAAEKGTNTGFIAQEVMALLPNDVQRSDPEDENSTLGINSMALVATLTGALKEAIAKIEALETSNADLTARVTALENA